MPDPHPLFPSGPWEGFYLYGAGPMSTRHEMNFHLDFEDGRVTGSGSDDIGGFTWEGTYDTTTFVCQMVKQYVSHPVHYRGMADESGIYGQWQIPPFSSGGFHIWPSKGKEEEVGQEVEVEELSRTFTAA
ncbi:MAG: hypothetical protein AAF840_04720 [Bacteroidota bacterium]